MATVRYQVKTTGKWIFMDNFYLTQSHTFSTLHCSSPWPCSVRRNAKLPGYYVKTWDISTTKSRNEKIISRTMISQLDINAGAGPEEVSIEISTKKERRKEIFYFIDTFYLRLYGFRHMVKDLANSEKREPADAKWATLSDQQQGFFYMHHLTDRIVHTTVFVTPIVEHWLEREIAQWIQHDKSIQRPIAPWANALIMVR